ncbi:hypothetical protein [Streptomyces violascens]|uniref:hypothetical protein n=1 Tax=Streptomyces violascens TaxID=67381 RepID=UPI001675925F|nr:hypothetical protein [Streptomyces violascens]GGU39051.1 hypothetical protein GCM10010289_69910 [Streptomyces violascens]
MATPNGILNGLEVIEFEFAETPKSTPANPRYFKEVLRVLLADGTVVYNCVWPNCEFTRPKASGVWPHVKAHKNQTTRTPKATADLSDIDVDGLPLAEVIDRARKATWYSVQLDAALKKLEKTTRELDVLKPRAKAAETQLASIRKAFAAVA